MHKTGPCHSCVTNHGQSSCHGMISIIISCAYASSQMCPMSCETDVTWGTPKPVDVSAAMPTIPARQGTICIWSIPDDLLDDICVQMANSEFGFRPVKVDSIGMQVRTHTFAEKNGYLSPYTT